MLSSYMLRKAQGRRLCGTTWVTSNIAVTQKLPAIERRNLNVPRKPRRPEKRHHAREELRTEDLERFGGFCSGCVRRHSWPVIAQVDCRPCGGGGRELTAIPYWAREPRPPHLARPPRWDSG